MRLNKFIRATMDKDGKLDKEEQDAIKSWIDSKTNGSLNCEICGHDNWVIAPHLMRGDVCTQMVICS